MKSYYIIIYFQFILGLVYHAIHLIAFEEGSQSVINSHYQIEIVGIDFLLEIVRICYLLEIAGID